MKSLKISKLILIALPLFLIYYSFLPKRTIHEVPVTQSVTLSDSIPMEYYRQLNVVEKQGRQYIGEGKIVTYLEYVTDADQLLKTIGNLPFSTFAIRADTVCMEIGFYGFETLRKTVSQTELQAGAYFWNVEHEQYQRYECVKGNEKHTLLINRFSDQVLHRIEYT